MSAEPFRRLEITDFYKERAETFNGHRADGTSTLTRHETGLMPLSAARVAPIRGRLIRH